MSSPNRSDKNLLTLSDADKQLRVLFMAPYAPDGPGYHINSYQEGGSYPEYYFEIFNRLKRLGFQVESTSKPYSIVHASGMTDYIFSLFNRLPIRNSEIFISSYCEFLNLPYLGACPNIRSVAEDKFVSKMLAKSLGIPVPRGLVYHHGLSSSLKPPTFPGPYFIKDRYGAGSEGLSAENLQDDWAGAKRIIESIWEQGTDALLEEFIEGIDLTVPFLGDHTPITYGVIHPHSDKSGNILTEDLKLTDVLGYRLYEVGEVFADMQSDALHISNSLGAIDYFRLDYRFNPDTNQRYFLEINICCYIGEDGPFGLTAKNNDIHSDELLEHIIAYSLLRQKEWRKYNRRQF